MILGVNRTVRLAGDWKGKLTMFSFSFTMIDARSKESGSEEEGAGGRDGGDTSEAAGETGDGKAESTGQVAESEVAPKLEGATVAGDVVVPASGVSPDDGFDLTVTEWIDILENKDDEAVLGLRVYTQTKEPAVIVGRIKCDDVTWEV